MAQIPEKTRGTVGELIGLLAAIPSTTPVLLINDCHSCSGWLDGFAYDREANAVDLTASGDSTTRFGR